MMPYILLLLVLFTNVAHAEIIVQPGEASASRANDDQRFRARDGHQRSWEAEPFETIVSSEGDRVREEDLIGAYRQPRWTANRRFTTTRLYVAPPGTFNIEYWVVPKFTLGATSKDHTDYWRSLLELEFGIGYHMQLDIYLVAEQERSTAKIQPLAEKIELRWALADWDVIPGNPTLYAEWNRKNGTPVGEFKLLSGGVIAPRWHWGANLLFEREFLGTNLTQEYGITGGLAYTLLDEQLSLGLEATFVTEDQQDHRFSLNDAQWALGPSMLWRPVPAMRILLVGLFGAELSRPKNQTVYISRFMARPMLILGWEV